MATGGKETVPVGDETDEEKAGDEDERRPVLGGRRPGLVGGEQHRRQQEPAAAGSRTPAQDSTGRDRVFPRPDAPHCRSVPRRAGAETAVASSSSGYQAAAALTSVVSSALDSAFHSAQ